jgi:hypothetical protein
MRRIGLRWLARFGLGTGAPPVLAQVAPPGGAGMHGRGRDNPARQDCRKQADEQKLPAGDERQKFVRQCVESKPGGSDAAKAAAAREDGRPASRDAAAPVVNASNLRSTTPTSTAVQTFAEIC